MEQRGLSVLKADYSRCLHAVSYTHLDVYKRQVENNSTEEQTFTYYKELEEKCPRAKVVYWKEKGFNYPKINNYGVQYAKGEYILFLNNDTEIQNPDCLEEMLIHCSRPEVGAVGAVSYTHLSQARTDLPRHLSLARSSSVMIQLLWFLEITFSQDMD